MDSTIMNAQQTKRLQACVQEISEILYQNTPTEELTTLEGIEKAVRGHMLKQVSPRVGFFLSKQVQAQRAAKPAPSKAVSENYDSKQSNFSD
jgi:hypothetical protein